MKTKIVVLLSLYSFSLEGLCIKSPSCTKDSSVIWDFEKVKKEPQADLCQPGALHSKNLGDEDEKD